MMNDIFRTLIAEGIVVVYLDDILIFTQMEEEHEQAVQRVLEVLAEHKLFLCPEKCEFHQKQIEYLRLVISENKVEMDPIKVARVHDWPILENRTDVQAFIGFVNFYRRFIQSWCRLKIQNPSASKLTAPTSPPELSSLSNYLERRNGTQWPSTANPCL